MKSTLFYVFTYLGIGTTITFLWRWYELSTQGYIEPDIFDSFIAMVLTLSLVLNVMFYHSLKK